MESTKYLKITCWNSRGFSTAIPYLRRLVDENDVVAVSEHWLHENRISMFREVSDKISFCGRASKLAQAENYGTKRGQGGVAILWRKELHGVTEISDIVHDRICGIKIVTVDGGVINILAVYMPADGSDEDLEPCLDDLIEILESRGPGEVNIVCGDFNADLGSSGGVRSKKVPNKRGQALFKVVNEFGFTACNLQRNAGGPLNTYHGPTGETAIDYILVPQQLQDRIVQCQVLEEEALNTSLRP